VPKRRICRAHVAPAAKAPISPKPGRPIQRMRLSETRGCAVGASKAANASPSSDIPILLAAGNPNMDRQRYCRGRRAGDPQSGHTPRGRGADRALSQRPDCRALDFCQFRV
jgi:hypothetical protein